MTGHRLEVADVLRAYGSQFMERYGSSLSIDQKCVYQAVLNCRTPTLGGHLHQCDECGHQLVLYNSCRNRHCPKCQAIAAAKWTEARAAELLPIPYFHVVFTLPQEIGAIALQNKDVVYGVLFRAVAETLKELTADPKHLGAEVGVLAVLHTWGQSLVHHPHLHCVVSGGGISPDGRRWVHCKRSRKSRKRFFIPVGILSRVFRGKFIALLKREYRRGTLKFFGELASLAHPAAFELYLNRAVRSDWVVYAKRPFGTAERVLKYLARYTHRVAISNRRLLALGDGKVRFEWKDYAQGGKVKTMELAATEFIRRFLLHTLPHGFMRIRHYGFLANRFRQEKFLVCRRLLGVGNELKHPDEPRQSQTEPIGAEVTACRRCPKCAAGRMRMMHVIPPATEACLVEDDPLSTRAPPTACLSAVA